MARRQELMRRLSALKKKQKPKKKRKKRKPKAIYNPNEKLELRDFQKDGVRWLEKNNFRAILADAQGTGKTVQALSCIARNQAKLLPVLVVCPSSVVWNWERESIRWVGGVRVHVVEDMKEEFPIVPANITICSWDMLVYRQEELEKMNFNFLIADEAHYIKNPESQRHQAFLRVLGDSPYALLMTGTPLINNQMEFEILKNVIGDNETPILRRILEDVDKSVPPKNRITVPVVLPEELRSEYDSIVNEFGDFIESYLRKSMKMEMVEEKKESLLKAEYLAKITYLRRLLGRAKVPVVAKWIEKMVKNKKPVVIFGEHVEVLDLLAMILNKKRIKFVRYDGTTSRVNRQIAIDAFQLGRVSVILCSKSACEGITLTRSHNLAFVQRFWTPASEEQAEDRIHRMGQTKRSDIWLFEVVDSYDERLSEILEIKREIIEENLLVEEVLLSETQEIKSKKHKDIKTLTEQPHVKPKFPDLPHRKFLKGIIFDPYSWSSEMLQRGLKRRGYQVRDVVEKESGGFINLRASQQFQHKRWERQLIAEGMIALTGRPVRQDRERQRRYRRT